jgi:hypothetical protein
MFMKCDTEISELLNRYPVSDYGELRMGWANTAIGIRFGFWVKIEEEWWSATVASEDAQTLLSLALDLLRSGPPPADAPLTLQNCNTKRSVS